ncbi:MAG: 50S ribosomal protein P1 [Nanoarchaeota archaeon]|nr:50S ribosomal protein P1 [Nanoarchaeota archaeon]
MEYMYAALLLHKAGKKVEEKELKAVLTSAGVKVDDSRVKALVAALEGIDIDKVVSQAPVMAAAPAHKEEVKTEEKKEVKTEEKKEEAKKEAAAGLGALFG